jgi:hypothetical protein
MHNGKNPRRLYTDFIYVTFWSDIIIEMASYLSSKVKWVTESGKKWEW